MKLTVLGAYGPYPPTGKACSGYLLQDGDCNLLIDCGNGVLSRLQKFISVSEISAIFISHLHADHISDLFILRYALQIKANGSNKESGKLEVYIPEEPFSESARLAGNDYYKINYIGSDLKISKGPFSIIFLETVHASKCYAMRIECGGKSILYSGDTEYFPALEGFAAGADLFLCEANYQEKDMEFSPANHLSAGQAAKIALNANVGKLLITHLSPNNVDEVSLKEAKNIFNKTELALENNSYDI